MTGDTGHITCDMWHMTHNMWHMTHDSAHAALGGRWTLSQNASSLALTVLEWRHFEDFEEKDDWLADWMSNKAPVIQLVLMIHWTSAQHVKLIYSMQVNFVTFSFKTAIWKKLKLPKHVKITADKFCD